MFAIIVNGDVGFVPLVGPMGRHKRCSWRGLRGGHAVIVATVGGIAVGRGIHPWADQVNPKVRRGEKPAA